MSSGLPVRPVETTNETQPFWDATSRSVLCLPRCNACQHVIWYPRLFCPECASQDVSWFESAGLGTIYTFSITRKGAGVWAGVSPYVIAYVDLDEGPRVLSNIVGCDPDSVSIGQRVGVTWDPIDESRSVYRFTPVLS